MNAVIRPVRAGDLDALYEICLLTGDAGRDASGLYADPRILGEIYAAPYAVLEPGLAFVVEDAEGVAGYIVGCADTLAFEARLEAEWRPALRRRYADPRGTPRPQRTPDQAMAALIHRPVATPQALTGAWPAHLHINLLPRLQGQGLGERLIGTFLQAAGKAGAPGVHLGCHRTNARALRFYEIYGFRRIDTDPPWPDTVWMAIQT